MSSRGIRCPTGVERGAMASSVHASTRPVPGHANPVSRMEVDVAAARSCCGSELSARAETPQGSMASDARSVQHREVVSAIACCGSSSRTLRYAARASSIRRALVASAQASACPGCPARVRERSAGRRRAAVEVADASGPAACRATSFGASLGRLQRDVAATGTRALVVHVRQDPRPCSESGSATRGRALHGLVRRPTGDRHSAASRSPSACPPGREDPAHHVQGLGCRRGRRAAGRSKLGGVRLRAHAPLPGQVRRAENTAAARVHSADLDLNPAQVGTDPGSRSEPRAATTASVTASYALQVGARSS